MCLTFSELEALERPNYKLRFKKEAVSSISVEADYNDDEDEMKPSDTKKLVKEELVDKHMNELNMRNTALAEFLTDPNEFDELVQAEKERGTALQNWLDYVGIGGWFKGAPEHH